MKWKKFTLTTTTQAVDLISSMFDDIGIEGIEIEDNVPLTEKETKGMFIDILPELPPDEGVARISFYLDDDADVAFTRNQYEAFMKVAPRELPDTMELLEPDSYRGGKAFYDFTPRIIYKKSKCHEDSPEMQYYEGKLNHIWVDLFILDKLPASRAGAEFTRFLHKAVYGMAMGHRYKLDFGKYSLIHKIFVGGLAAAGRLVPMKLIFAMQKAAALKDRHSKGSLRYYSNYQPDYLYVTVDKSCCDQVEDSDFEDTRLMIPKGWHQILTEVYGNYMEMPPEDKRVPTHSSQQIRIFD